MCVAWAKYILCVYMVLWYGTGTGGLEVFRDSMAGNVQR